MGRLAIAHASLPGDKTVLAAVLLYLLVSAMASIPYVNWRKRIDEDIAGRSARYSRTDCREVCFIRGG